MAKKVKTVSVPKVWADKQWTVRFGRVNAGPGRPEGAPRLFRVLGEKLPFEAINSVNSELRTQGVRRTGVYVAHDSMGYARYIGRGSIFSRLRARRKICGTGGLPRRDFQRQKSLKPFRCQPVRVSGLTIMRALFQSNSQDHNTKLNRAASVSGCGLILCSR